MGIMAAEPQPAEGEDPPRGRSSIDTPQGGHRFRAWRQINVPRRRLSPLARPATHEGSVDRGWWTALPPQAPMRKCLHRWCGPRSSKPLGRRSTWRPVGSIPIHFRHFPKTLCGAFSKFFRHRWAVELLAKGKSCLEVAELVRRSRATTKKRYAAPNLLANRSTTTANRLFHCPGSTKHRPMQFSRKRRLRS